MTYVNKLLMQLRALLGRLIHGFGFLSKAEFISLLISIVLIVLTLIVSDTIYNSNLEYKDKISILIFLITCLGGLLATNFFIMNVIAKNPLFILLSQLC